MMRQHQGLTLIEVVLAIAILAIVVLMFSGIQTFSLRTARGAADTHELVREAEATIERVTGRYLSGTPLEHLAPDGVDGNVTVQIERCAYDTEEIHCKSPEAIAEDKEVGVFITAIAHEGDHEEQLYRFVKKP